MPRGSFACLLAAAAVLAAGCSTLPGSDEAPTEDIEQALAESDFHAGDAKCEEAASGWDYVCHFQRRRPSALEDRRPRRRPATDEALGSRGGDRHSGVAARDRRRGLRRLARSSQRSLQAVNVEMKALPTPRSRAEFETYIDSVQRIGLRYSARLASLPPPPKLTDRETYGRLLLMLGEDNRQAGELRKAVHDRDRAAGDRLLRDLASRNSAENELFNRLGGDC
jgi:hypothetical protein